MMSRSKSPRGFKVIDDLDAVVHTTCRELLEEAIANNWSIAKLQLVENSTGDDDVYNFTFTVKRSFTGRAVKEAVRNVRERR